MSCKELQEEELEVLQSIYDGDDCFKQVSDTVFQYKVVAENEFKSFLVEAGWGPSYPEELPEIKLDAFFNKHILDEVKNSIVSKLLEQAEMFLGSAMTYTVFEWAKENAEDLMRDQPDTPPQYIPQTTEESKSSTESTTPSVKKVKKEQLTKAQKRKLVNRLDNMGELPRGHDWVDVIKHLSQTGKAADNVQ